MKDASKEGRLLEAFGAGTAAIVSPIESITHKGQEIKVLPPSLCPLPLSFFSSISLLLIYHSLFSGSDPGFAGLGGACEAADGRHPRSPVRRDQQPMVSRHRVTSSLLPPLPSPPFTPSSLLPPHPPLVSSCTLLVVCQLFKKEKRNCSHLKRV